MKKVTGSKLKLLNRNSINQSHTKVTDEVFRSSQTAFTEKLDFL